MGGLGEQSLGALDFVRCPGALQLVVGRLQCRQCVAHVSLVCHQERDVFSQTPRKDRGTQSQGGAGRSVLFAVGLAATLAVTVVITRIARQALSRAVEESAAGVPAESVESAVESMEGVTP